MAEQEEEMAAAAAADAAPAAADTADAAAPAPAAKTPVPAAADEAAALEVVSDGLGYEGGFQGGKGGRALGECRGLA